MNHGVLITLGVVAYTALVFWAGTYSQPPIVIPEPAPCPHCEPCGTVSIWTFALFVSAGVLLGIVISWCLSPSAEKKEKVDPVQVTLMAVDQRLKRDTESIRNTLTTVEKRLNANEAIDLVTARTLASIIQTCKPYI